MAKKKSVTKILFYVFLFLVLIGAVAGYKGWQMVFSPNVKFTDKKYTFFYIHTGSGYDQVLQQLANEKIISNTLTFDWVAALMNYPKSVKPGKYRILNGMSNRELINLLRSGNQEQVSLVIRSMNSLQDLASLVGRKLEADSSGFYALITNDSVLQSISLNSETIMAMFIPNTYNFYWNTSSEKVFNRLKEEYLVYWNEERRRLADSLGLNPVQVSIVASIVEKETQKRDEMPVVAGVYLNRLKKGMLLQADPTVIFAMHDPNVRRVTSAMLQTESPYNTYKYKGLPPGPICIPSQMAIEAVLHRNAHQYIYFCAKEDFSGYHNFAENIEQHLVNARKYQHELNKRKIFK
ncbi:MAG: endolytic transglycosylase MltG [Bacteroidia bacterium]|nr:endolytic transglycosylase MltG [Bacteroidia bacterium]